MCIAILNAGKQLTKKKLQNCWNNNDDGAGMLYINADGELQAEKFSNSDYLNSDLSFNTFYERYTELKGSVGEQPMLLHFRIATHGLTDEYLHPFFVSDTLGLIHNGVIPGFGTTAESDTSEFTKLLGSMPGMNDCEMLDIPFIEDAIFTYLGTTNKLVFLDKTGEYRIFNEGKGEWIGDNWFSNDSHSRAVRYYGSTAVPAKGSITSGWGDWSAPVTRYAPEGYVDSFDENELGAYHSRLAAPTETLYDCPKCKAEVEVNYDCECVNCGTYIESSVSEVIDLWDDTTTDDYAFEQDQETLGQEVTVETADELDKAIVKLNNEKS